MNNNYELIFNKKPKLKIGEKVSQVLAENGFHKYYGDVFVEKIEKNGKTYKVYLKQG